MSYKTGGWNFLSTFPSIWSIVKYKISMVVELLLSSLLVTITLYRLFYRWLKFLAYSILVAKILYNSKKSVCVSICLSVWKFRKKNLLLSKTLFLILRFTLNCLIVCNEIIVLVYKITWLVAWQSWQEDNLDLLHKNLLHLHIH